MDDSRAESISAFFEEVRAANKEFKAMVAIIDNFASHRSAIVREKVDQLDIYLLYLPPHSPDLNPIEFIWKSIKRVLSLELVQDLDQIRKIISEEWNRISQSISYANSWIKKFLININNFNLDHL